MLLGRLFLAILFGALLAVGGLLMDLSLLQVLITFIIGANVALFLISWL